MRMPLLLAVCAGLLSAVIFAAAAAVPLLPRAVLFFLTPLPICLVGLGLGWRLSAIAGTAAILGILAAAGPRFALTFAATEAVPIAALTYLALLRRTVAGTPPGPAAIEWYPVGRLVFWAALVAGVLALLSLIVLGGDLDAVRKALRAALDSFVEAQLTPGAADGGPAALAPEDMDKLAESALYLFPAFLAMSWMTGLLFTLWLAGRILLAAGRLTRPWPDLARIAYPRGTPLALAATIALPLFVTGYPALVASGFAGALFLAYVLLGLAIVHFVTRGQGWRPFALWALYLALVALSSFVAPLLAVLGLSETIIPLRREPRAPPPSGTA